MLADPAAGPRTIARDPGTAPEQRDAIWRDLVQRTRREPEPWRLAAVWVMLPGLRAAAHRLAQRTRLDIAEIRSALIAGFLEALGTIDPQRENLGSALYWSSYTSARATCRAYGRELPTEDIDRAGKPHDVPDVPVHSGVVATTRRTVPARGTLEGERLGSIAHRAGVADRIRPSAWCRQRILHPTGAGPQRRGIALRVCADPASRLTAASAHATEAVEDRR